MVITCPNCRTRFQIPPESLGDRGRNVRCSSCGHSWFVEPFARPAPPEPASVPAEPGLLPENRRSEVPPTPPVELPPSPTPLNMALPREAGRRGERSGKGLIGWLALALLVLLLVAAVVGRNSIVAAFPAALPLYERLGLPVTLELGLAFRDLGSSRRDEPAGSTVVVTGTIVNTAGREVRVPKLRIALLDESQAEIESGFYDPPQQVLPADGTARFEIALENPPDEARDFTITFADRP